MDSVVSLPLLTLWHQLRYVLLAVAITSFLARKWRQHVVQRKSFDKDSQDDRLLPTSTISETTLRTSLGARSRGPARRVTGQKPARMSYSPSKQAEKAIQPLIFFATVAGGTEGYAKAISTCLSRHIAESNSITRSHVLEAKVLDLSDIELEDYFSSAPKDADADHFYIVLFPSYNIDTNLSNFLEHLRETHYDFRVDTAPLAGLLGYAVLGFGDKEGWPTEEEGFCTQAKQVDQWLSKLTSNKRAYPLGMVDVKGKDAETRIDDWQAGISTILRDLAAGSGLGEGVAGSGEAFESNDEDEEANVPTSRTQPAEKRRAKAPSKSTLDDLENLGTSLRPNPPTQPSPLPIDFTTTTPTLKPMVPATSPTHTALTKQGYTIIGTHSGVKICRWTKSALRGRGSCYKHSFYGIASHTCMEATPALSCSNKCVFCWRHGTNPVGTVWRWATDPPADIFTGMKAGHYTKIKMLRGVPGVRAERFEEAMRIRHCALSLVGEPLFYPRINELLALLHSERISTFLVCNAQHPAQLRDLAPVTQLYVSIDAADAATLRRIDRPLHRDFWARFLECLDIVRAKRERQRTVYRLTLVKGFNVEAEAAGYAELVARGRPAFVEVKGVTYCGTSTSKSAGLTMGNVPFYGEVVEFVEALERACRERGLDYGIAAEHAHSCCVLLAERERFYKEGTWWTNIDYGRFFEELEGGECGEGVPPERYMARTPEWALWGRGGFDPRDERVMRKGKKAKEGREAEAKAVEVE